MATVSFLLQSKSENAQIYIRLSNGRNGVFKKKTQLFINPNNWSNNTNYPKQSNAENKKLYNTLNDLKSFVLNNLTSDSSKGVTIDSFWLEKKIDECFGRVQNIERDFLVNHIQSIIENAAVRETKNGKIGYSKSTIKNYKCFKNKILDYQNLIKKQIRFSDLDKSFTDDFKYWLLETKGHAVNNAGKQLEFLKTVSRDAEKFGVTVHRNVLSLRTIRESSEDRYIQTLSFTELEQINNTIMPRKVLDDTKKWIIIGCFIGQRQGDLLKIKKEDFYHTDKGLVIDVLIQEKTVKHVPIAIPKKFKYVVDIILNDFPDYVSKQRFNKYMKEVCEIAELNIVQKGNVYNGKKNLVEDEKWKMIASHCCRRSFATNYYELGVDTQTLMQITGHSEEKMFLSYINKRTPKNVFVNRFFDSVEKKLNEQENQSLKTNNLKIV